MTEIRHIVFDVGRVLVHYDPHQAYYDLIPVAAEREAFLRDVCSHDWNIEQDRGRSWEEAEAEAMEALETRILAGLGIADPYRP